MLTNLNPGIREILLSYNMFHRSVGSTTNPRVKNKENKRKMDASQIAAKVAALLQDNKKILEEAYIHCAVAI